MTKCLLFFFFYKVAQGNSVLLRVLEDYKHQFFKFSFDLNPYIVALAVCLGSCPAERRTAIVASSSLQPLIGFLAMHSPTAKEKHPYSQI